MLRQTEEIKLNPVTFCNSKYLYCFDVVKLKQQLLRQRKVFWVVIATTMERSTTLATTVIAGVRQRTTQQTPGTAS